MRHEVTYQWFATTKNYNKFKAVNPPPGWILTDYYLPVDAGKEDFKVTIER